jgi:CHAT domain-containing protein
MMFLVDRENVYTHLVKATIAESPEGAFAFSEKARSRALRERLVNQNVTGSVSDIVSRLSAEESLVEYFISGDDVFIFVLTRAGLFTAERRGAVPVLKTLVQYFERHIDSCSVKWERLAPVRRHLDATVQAHLQGLYQELIAPVQAELRETVVFAPHGFLHNVPLHALHDGKQYLDERHKVAYTPGALLYCSPAARQEFGSPLFIAFSTGRDCSSADEVSESAAQVNGAAILVNPSMDQLRHAFEQPRSLIHIAGHAGIDTVGGKLSWIQTSQGRLTSRDLSEMHIRAKTLVITGCQSARRMIRPGDEWLGLMRSFYLAGASTIVSALWDIRDESARRFAREFYKGFDGKDAPAAVQRAASVLRGWRAHPYFWAGFGAFIRKEQ